MAGLEQINATILKDARAEAAAILADGQAKAEEILKTARTNAEAAAQSKREAAVKKAASIRRAAKSAGALDTKNRLLAARTEMIESVFQKSLHALRSLDTDRYFQVIRRLCVLYALDGTGVLVLSPADRKRIPADFMDSLAGSLPSSKQLVLTEETDDRINGGFRLRYGDILINGSFEAILEEKREALTDEVNRFLFA